MSKDKVQLPLSAEEWQAFATCLKKSSPPSALLCAYLMRLTGLHASVIVQFRANYFRWDNKRLQVPGEVVYKRGAKISADKIVQLAEVDFVYLSDVRKHGLPDTNKRKSGLVSGGLRRHPFQWPTTENGFLFPATNVGSSQQEKQKGAFPKSQF